MSRPLRIEFPDALYHVSSHGNGNLWLYKDPSDIQGFIDCLLKTVKKYHFTVFAFTLLKDQYHLLVKTPEGNLARGMMQFNRELAILYNKKNNRKGSVFRHRYDAVLVQEESHFGQAYSDVTGPLGHEDSCHSPEMYEGSHLYWLSKGDERTRRIISFPASGHLSDHVTPDQEDQHGLSAYLLGCPDWIQEMKTLAKKRPISNEIREGWKFFLKGINEMAIRAFFHPFENRLASDVLMFIRHKLTDITLAKLGQMNGIRNAKTVSSRIRRIKESLAVEPRILAALKMAENIP